MMCDISHANIGLHKLHSVDLDVFGIGIVGFNVPIDTL